MHKSRAERGEGRTVMAAATETFEPIRSSVANQKPCWTASPPSGHLLETPAAKNPRFSHKWSLPLTQRMTLAGLRYLRADFFSPTMFSKFQKVPVLLSSNMFPIGMHPLPTSVLNSRALYYFFERPEDSLTFWRAVQSRNWHIGNVPQSDSPRSISGIKDLIKGLLSFIHKAHHIRETLSKGETHKPKLVPDGQPKEQHWPQGGGCPKPSPAAPPERIKRANQKTGLAKGRREGGRECQIRFCQRLAKLSSDYASV